jgi:hypothetical protein
VVNTSTTPQTQGLFSAAAALLVQRNQQTMQLAYVVTSPAASSGFRNIA